MSELTFDVLDIRPEQYAVAPTLMARLRIAETTGDAVHAMVLRAQVRIEPQRRNYSPEEKAGLLDLFGDTGRWGETARPFLWTHCVTTVSGFRGSTEVELPLPCSYDFEVAASKYLHALGDGEVPLVLLFNGTVFTRGATGFAVSQIPWHKEASYRLPVAVWRELMDQYFPNSGWLRLERDMLARLQRYKSERALPTWEEAFAALLKEAGQDAP